MARARAIAEKLGKAGVNVSNTSNPPTTPAPANLPPKPTTISKSSNGAADALAALPDKDEISRRVAEARRLVANANTQAALSSNPYIVSELSRPAIPHYQHSSYLTFTPLSPADASTREEKGPRHT